MSNSQLQATVDFQVVAMKSYLPCSISLFYVAQYGGEPDQGSHESCLTLTPLIQADIAGIPESTLPPNDGYSLVPTLEGKTQEQPK